jgi:hypothetical protein
MPQLGAVRTMADGMTHDHSVTLIDWSNDAPGYELATPVIGRLDGGCACPRVAIVRRKTQRLPTQLIRHRLTTGNSRTRSAQTTAVNNGMARSKRVRPANAGRTQKFDRDFECRIRPRW